ncbi:glutamyl-tRNA(Gln) amidotransferase subunit A [Cupriavidus necator N-1]|uniref:Glutamyl-tRNA(Gln) amidotransferase subunit A n=1 Tax=Cupriavidus necator (strain ATCC 43291 / DSM 13513 / CCUG 52238 / LMG 8453 / N-1) TaxID=1042878 RepID=F8GQF6_CUPNN|nr:amidase [Cupriavidus necator]AEI79428.1 glutamyl-tRNA(Gln) amidotransferase subunit A [Cupriavidus necator N-1]KAI3601802.1 putative amidase [Cupriavidus necator H850]MDX6010936.1 amidase [Cupriavidus necator]
MEATIATAQRQLAAGSANALSLLASCVERICNPGSEGARVFPHGVSMAARKQAQASDMLREQGVVGPLAGVPVSVKDLFDVQGDVTRAGARVLPERAASADAPAIARLRAAGAVFVGRTNMTEFAYSGVGINPHYGTPRNPYDRQAGRIPGGSSSGAAVSVTDGMALAAIGSDTGGSCRIPAALCGIAGFKPTARRVPLQGTVPLSPSYDSVGCLANTVACCAAIDAVMAGEAPPAGPAPLAGLRLAVPSGLVLEGMSDEVAEVFSRTLRRLSAAGALLQDVSFDSWDQLAGIGANGGLVAAEASAWHGSLLAEQADRYDPRVLSRIRLADGQRAADYLRMLQRRGELCRQADAELAGFDAVVLPTVPVVAPRIANLDDDEAFFRTNRLLLRNPAIANMLDLCALSVPCHRLGDAPVGLMLFGRHLSDRRLLAIGMGIEAALRHERG